MWSDERIDDAVGRIEKGIDLMRDDMREMRTEMNAGFTSLRREMLYAVLAMSSVLVATMATILAKTL